MLEKYIGYEWSMYIVCYLLGLATAAIIWAVVIAIKGGERDASRT
ncbi:hypothetical protein [Brevibacillus fortis]